MYSLKKVSLLLLSSLALTQTFAEAADLRGTPNQDVLVRIARAEFDAGRFPQEADLRIGTQMTCQVLNATRDNFTVTNSALMFSKQGHLYFTAGGAGDNCGGSSYNEGYNDGYSEGHYDGYNDGYDDGYDDGYWDCKKTSLEPVYATKMPKKNRNKIVRAECATQQIWQKLGDGSFSASIIRDAESNTQSVRVGGDGALYIEIGSSTATEEAAPSVRDASLKAITYVICH